MSIGQFNLQTAITAVYHLNSDPYDLSGNGYHGAANVISYVNGITGQGAYFNGASSSIQLPDTLDALLKSGSYSVLALIKTPASLDNPHVILSKSLLYVGGYSNAWYGWDLALYNTYLRAFRSYGQSGAVTHTLQVSETVTTSSRYAVLWTYNRTAGDSQLFLYKIGTNAYSSASGNLLAANVAMHPYHNGWRVGARLGDRYNMYATPYYSEQIINELVLFNDVKTEGWFKKYVAWIRGY